MYDDTFNAKDYVEKNCSSYIYGLQSCHDMQTIENDSNLTYEQKEAAQAELRHLASVYY